MGKYLLTLAIVLGTLVMGFALVGVAMHWTQQTPEEIIKEAEEAVYLPKAKTDGEDYDFDEDEQSDSDMDDQDDDDN